MFCGVVEMMPTPGAPRSTVVAPKLENEARLPAAEQYELTVPQTAATAITES